MKLKADYILRELMGECILIPVGSTAVADNSISIMTETGAIIVKGLQAGKGKEEILAQILEEYEVGKDQAEADYEEFLDMLRKNDLVEE